MDNQWILARVLEVKQEARDFVSIKVVPELEGFRFDFRAGQYVEILLAGGGRGYFAMASEPEEKRFIEFLVKDHSEGPAHDLYQVKADERLRLSPPKGNGYSMERLRGRNVLLIGIGSALSPLRSLLKSMLRQDDRFGQIALIYGAKTAADIPYRQEFDRWAKKIDLKLALSRPDRSEWSGFIGRVTALLSTLTFDHEKTAACICGTPAMEKEVRIILEQNGFKEENILVNL